MPTRPRGHESDRSRLRYITGMRVIDTGDALAPLPGCAVCLGFFDGVHRGHMALVERAKAIARREGLLVCVHALDRSPYQALHPEDTEATEADISDVTLKAVMTNQIYNDLGFTVLDRTMVLMEAQSTWSWNIAVRAMMYLGKTFQE